MAQKVFIKDRGIAVEFPDNWTSNQIEDSIAKRIDPVFYENKQRQESKLKDFVDVLTVQGSSIWQTSKEAFTDFLPSYLFSMKEYEEVPDKKGLYRRTRPGIGGMEAARRIFAPERPTKDMTKEEYRETIERGMISSVTGELAKRAFSYVGRPTDIYHTKAELDRMKESSDQILGVFNKINEKSKKNYQNWLANHPELMPRDEYNGNVIDLVKNDPKLLSDPAFWAFKAAEIAPFSLAVGAVGGITTYATKDPVKGTIAGMAAAAPMITQDLFKELKENGANERQAADVAALMGPPIALVESIGDLAVMLNITGSMKSQFRKAAVSEVVKRTVPQMIGKTAVEVGKGYSQILGTEMAEEVVQEGLTNAAVSVFNKNRNLLTNQANVIANTFVGMAPTAGFGGSARIKGVWSEMMDHNNRKGMTSIQFAMSVNKKRIDLQKAVDDGTATDKEKAELNTINMAGNDEQALAAIYGVRIEQPDTKNLAVREIVPTPGEFRSKLEDELELMEQKSMTPEQLLGYLKKRGVSDLELDVILGEALWDMEKNQMRKSVTKEEMLERVRQEKFMVEDIEYGEEGQGYYDNSESEGYQEDANGYEYERDQAEQNRDEAGEREGEANYRVETLTEEIDRLDPEDFESEEEYQDKKDELEADLEQAEEDQSDAEREYQEYQDEYDRAESNREDAQQNADDTYRSEEDYEEQEGKHYGYTTKEGYNYREFLLKLPNNENYYSPPDSHWVGDRVENTFVHVRVTSVIDKQGKETFLIQEIQSDWDIDIQKQGGEQGHFFLAEWYEDTSKIPKLGTLYDLTEWAKTFDWGQDKTIDDESSEGWAKWVNNSFEAFVNNQRIWTKEEPIPDEISTDPQIIEAFRRSLIASTASKEAQEKEGYKTRRFKSRAMADRFVKSKKSSNATVRAKFMSGQSYLPVKGIFSDIAMKYMMMKAVREGAESITWVSGRDTRGIYTDAMRKTVDHIKYKKNKDGTWDAVPYDSGGSVVRGGVQGGQQINFHRMSAKFLKDVYGTYIANKIIQDAGEKGTRMTGALEGYSDFTIEKLEYPGFTRAEYNKERTRRRYAGSVRGEPQFTDEQYQEGIDYYDHYYRHALFGVNERGERELIRRTRYKKDFKQQIKENTDKSPRITGEMIKLGGEWTTKMYGDFESHIKEDYPTNPDMLKYAYEGKDASRMSVFARNYIKKYGGKLETIEVQTTEGEARETGRYVHFEGNRYQRKEGNRREDWEIVKEPLGRDDTPGLSVYRVMYKDRNDLGNVTEEATFSEYENADAAAKAQRFIDKQVRMANIAERTFSYGDFINLPVLGGERRDWSIRDEVRTQEDGTNIVKYVVQYKGDRDVVFNTRELAEGFIDKQIQMGRDNPDLYRIKKHHSDYNAYWAVEYAQQTVEVFNYKEDAEAFIKEEKERISFDTDWRKRRGFAIPEKLKKQVNEYGLHLAEQRRVADYASEQPSESDVAFGGEGSRQMAYKRFVDTFGGKGAVNKELRRQFKKRGYADMRGQKVNSPQDAAELTSIHRDPTVEIFQVLFVDAETNEVLSCSVETIGNPTMFPGGEIAANVSKMLTRYAKRGITAKFYLAHNHPSGNYEPSEADIMSTEYARREFGDLFEGHIVMDHDKFAFINKDVTGHEYIAYSGGDKQEFGGGIDARMLTAMGMIPGDEEHYTILYVDANNRMLGVGKVRADNPNMWEHIRQGQRANAAPYYVLVSEREVPTDRDMAEQMTAGLVSVLQIDKAGTILEDWAVKYGITEAENHHAFMMYQLNLPENRQAFKVGEFDIIRIAETPNTYGEDESDVADGIIDEVDKVNSEDEAEVKKSVFVRMKEATLAKIKAKKLAEGLRKGGPKTREEVKFVQGELKKLMVGLDFEGKGEMLAAVTGILTQEQLAKHLDTIYDRLQKIADKDKIDAYVKALTKLGQLKNLDPDYKEQVDDLLEDYDLKRRNKKTKAKRQKRSEFLERMRQSGDIQGIPDSLFVDLGKKTLDEMTADEVRELYDVVAMLVKLGQLKSKLISGKQARELESEVDELVGRIYEKTGLTEDMESEDILKTLEEKEDKSQEGSLKKMLGYFKGIWTQSIKIEHNTITLGIHKLFTRVHDGINTKKSLQEKYYGMMDKAFKKLGDYSEKLMERVPFKFKPHEGFIATDKQGNQIDREVSFTRQQILGIALNSGNEGNRQRLREGYGLSEENIDEIVGTLSDTEKQFVEEIWDIFDDMFPGMAEVTRNMLGIRVKKVKGRYFPIVVDRELSKLQQLRDAEQDLFMDVFQTAYINRSFSKARKGGVEPVDLNIMGVITQHIDNVIQYTALAQPIRDGQKIITHPRFRKAIIAATSEDMYNEYRKWLMTTANPNQLRAKDSAGKLATALRHNATLAILGLKVSVSAVQALSISQAVHVINRKFGGQTGSKAAAQASLEYLMNRQAIKAFVYERSQEMAQRRKSWDREVKDFVQNKMSKKLLKGKGIETKDWEETMFTWITAVDEQTTMTTWMAAFNSMYDIGKDNEAEAVEFADSVVRTTQPTGEVVNLPSIMKGGPWQKNMTMFMSHFINAHNLLVMELDRMKYSKDGALRKAAGFAEAYFFLVAAPSIAATFIRSGGEEDDWKKYLSDIVLYNLAGLFLARDLASAILSGFSFGQSAAMSAFQEVTYAARSKDLRKVGTHAAKAVSIGTGKVPIQAITTADGFIDLLTGEAKDFRRIVLSEYQLHGKAGKKSKGKKRRPARK